ncbi:hemerythrin domain-containing protein [Thioalkalivibrio sp. ALE19]|uniref:hemerythrin domain-containing protein n=1 Tax=Thioalkalivibrio sp. ALE19 TaxID=1266909 RepID=UPI00048EE883|nr:hemerythrin domain-containing protein [Thioalkalivibrio sp. ALE19]
MNLQMNEPLPGFDRPLEVLRACHRRLKGCLETLDRLQAHVPDHGADAEAQAAAQRLLKYFHASAPHHHADEDEDLFPRLKGLGNHPDCHPQLPDWLDRLTAEHETLENGWSRLEPALLDIAEGRDASLDGAAEWIDQYRRHLALEEEAVLPLAEHLLDADQCRAVGESMARRRDLEPESHG